MNLPTAGFETLACAVLDGQADLGQLADFRLLMHDNPDLLDAYIAQCDLHAALTTIAGGVDTPDARSFMTLAHPAYLAANGASGAPECAGTAIANSGHRTHGRNAASLVTAAAAALALVVTGTFVTARDWRRATGAGRFSAKAPPVASRQSPVKVLQRWRAGNLELPESLPGTMRMTNGRIKARLESGIELLLCGPFEMEVTAPKEARLVSGRMLADIPRESGGFTLRTPDLEMWDNGALFCVTVTEDGSDVFVFKGEVQVVEACGDPVDICRAGEGARARRDRRSAVKIAADWPEAAQLLASTSLEVIASDPDQAVNNAVMISDLWAERYLPEEDLRRSQRIANMYADARRIPFTRKAWVRPQTRIKSNGANSVWSAKEETEMTTKSAVGALLAAATLTGAGGAGAFSEPARIFFAPHLNRHWSAVYTNEVPINWEWPADAATAELSISGMNSSFSTNFSPDTSGYLWRAFDAAVPKTEDVYSLTLSFRDGASTVIETKTASLAVLKGSFGSATMDPGPDNRKWSKVSDNSVIPYDAEWDPATFGAVDGQIAIAKAGGSTQTNTLADAAGYFGWKLKNSGWGHGTFNLALTFPEVLEEDGWEATLLYLPGGTIISLR